MDSIKLTRMLIRLFSVLLVAWTASTIPWILTNYITATNEFKSPLYFGVSVFLPLFLPILIAIALWLFAGTISGKLNPKDERFSIDGFSEEKTFNVGLFFLGLYVSLYAFIDLVAHLTDIFTQVTNDDHLINAIITYPDLIATLVELGLGLFIALQRKGIMRIVNKMRGRN